MKAWKAGLERHFVLIRERMFLSGIFLSGMLLLGCQGQDAPEPPDPGMGSQEEAIQPAQA